MVEMALIGLCATLWLLGGNVTYVAMVSLTQDYSASFALTVLVWPAMVTYMMFAQ